MLPEWAKCVETWEGAWLGGESALLHSHVKNRLSSGLYCTGS